MTEHCKGQKQIKAARDAAQEKRTWEPSSEAKQAAEKAGFREGHVNHARFCEGYDTATAKLRDYDERDKNNKRKET